MISNYIFRKLKVNINDKKYDLFVFYFVFVVFTIFMTSFSYQELSSRLGCRNQWLPLFAQINVALASISLAIFAFWDKRENLSENHQSILFVFLHTDVFLGLVLCGVDCFVIALKVSECINPFLFAGECVFLLLFLASCCALLKPDWSRIVSDNANKYKDHTEDIKELKSLFYSFSVALDKNLSSASYYSHIEEIAKITKLSKNEIKFLKGLNDVVDNTKIGRDIKNPHIIIKQLKEIISKLPEEYQ